MSNFEQAYALLGYVRCNDGSREPGFERIAIYEDDRGVPTHAARQLPSGKWSSKCGRSYDIEHDLETDAGPGRDGEDAVYMRRPIP
jgi:hypothetical protein